MHITAIVFIIAAALCIIPSLVAGAIKDIKERRFPKEYWKWTPKIAGMFTFFAYLLIFMETGFYTPATWLAFSIVCVMVFYAAGIRFGSGGDWRALIYIALISPWLLPITVIGSLVAGFILAVVYLLLPQDPLDPIPVFMRTVPFAVAILIGYVVAIVLFAMHNL